MDAVDRILVERQSHFMDQLENRLDTLDIFLEGRSYGSDEPINPQDVYAELGDLVRTRFELNPPQIKELAEGPGDDLKNNLMNQLEDQLKDLELKRLIGGVERLLGEPLGGEEISPVGQDWDTIIDLIEEKVKFQFSERRRSFFEDPEDPRVVKAIEAGLNEIPGTRAGILRYGENSRLNGGRQKGCL